MESGRDHRGFVRQRKCDHNKTWNNLRKGKTMRKIIVEIEREKAEYIERLNFELGFAKDVIQRIIESHPNDPDIINSLKHIKKKEQSWKRSTNWQFRKLKSCIYRKQ